MESTTQRPEPGGATQFPLDSLPGERVAPALAMLKKLRSGQPFRAPIGSGDSIAVLDLVRARLVVIDGGGDASSITVRLA